MEQTLLCAYFDKHIQKYTDVLYIIHNMAYYLWLLLQNKMLINSWALKLCPSLTSHLFFLSCGAGKVLKVMVLKGTERLMLTINNFQISLSAEIAKRTTNNLILSPDPK